MLEQWINAKIAKGDEHAAKAGRSFAEEFGEEPLTSVEAPEIALQLEWNMQSQKLANLFAQELGLTKEEYIATLPKFEPQPERFKGRFDIPVIVETRLPLKEMLEKAGIVVYFDTNGVKDWDKKRFETPKTSYTAWLQDGRRNLNKSVEDIRRNLKSDERGGIPYDGISLYLRDPNILEHHLLDFPGSRVDSVRAPYLVRWGGQPGLSHSFVGRAAPNGGSVVAGKL